MIFLIAFLMLCCFGLGVSWNIVWVNIKELDAWIERRKQEEKQLVDGFKKNVDLIKKELDNNLMNKLNGAKK
jgi:predicted PurR-regulated permease PerM